MKRKKTGKIGSSFESFLIEKNLYEEASSQAIKRVIAWQIENEMKEKGITKTKMAVLMKTSRSQLNRLLDPANDNVSLETVQRAASVMGKRLVISFENVRAS